MSHLSEIHFDKIGSLFEDSDGTIPLANASAVTPLAIQG